MINKDSIPRSDVFIDGEVFDIDKLLSTGWHLSAQDGVIDDVLCGVVPFKVRQDVRNISFWRTAILSRYQVLAEAHLVSIETFHRPLRLFCLQLGHRLVQRYVLLVWQIRGR